MKSAVFYGKNDLRIEDIEIPELKEDEVLINVHACGICGTDMHIFDGDEGAAATPKKTVLGHEFAGEIVKIGEKVVEFNVGDRVCVDPNKLCNKCYYCRSGMGHFCTDMIGIGTTVNGGFSEYCAVPVSQIYKFSDKTTYAKAAMTEPVACCLHGIDMCNIKHGDTVAIIGAGMIGLIMLQLAKLGGARKLIVLEPIAEKRKIAESLGADLTIDSINEDVSAVLAENGIKQIDVVIECVGRINTLELGIEIAGKNSTLMMFGLTKPGDVLKIKPFEIFKKEIVLKASFINPYTQERALGLIDSGKIDVQSMIYREISLDELPKVLSDKKERALGKYIVNPEL